MTREVTRSVKFIGLGVLIGSLGGAGWYLMGRRDRTTRVEPTRLFEQVLGHVRSYGVDSLGEAELYRRAAEGLVRELDDEYATLIPAGGVVDHPRDPGGLGLMLFGRDERVIVQGVLPGSPADRAGVRPGDQLVAVGEEASTPQGGEELRATLEGPEGSPVEVSIRRPGIRDVLRFSMRRETPREDYESSDIDLGRGVHYIAIGLVGPATAREVRRLVRGFPTGASGLVLDLRGATGGRLEDVAALAELFLDRGAVIASVVGRGGVVEQVTASRPQELPDLAITVLVDGATADAAEGLAGALQDNDRALLIGEPTFGRGSRQEDYPLGDRWIVRMSTGRWVTPSGRRLEPDSAFGDSIAARPVFTTVEGRTVRGGGGIVPDSIVEPQGSSPALDDFFRVMGPSIPGFFAALAEVAMEISVVRVVPGWQPTDADLARLERVMRDRGVATGTTGFGAAREEVRELLARRAVAARLGVSGVVRRTVLSDPALSLGLQLLREARTPRELVPGR